MQTEHAGRAAIAQRDFLQSDDVGVDFAQHLRDPLRCKSAVNTYGRVHVVRGDGGQVAVGEAGGIVRLWEATTGKSLAELQTPWQRVSAISFSPVGDTLATAGTVTATSSFHAPGHGILWDLATRTKRQVVEGHSAAIEDLVFSPDGRRLATASRDGTVKVWDWERGQVLLTFGPFYLYTPAGREFLGVAFSPDGNRLGASMASGSIRVWEAAP